MPSDSCRINIFICVYWRTELAPRSVGIDLLCCATVAILAPEPSRLLLCFRSCSGEVLFLTHPLSQHRPVQRCSDVTPSVSGLACVSRSPTLGRRPPFLSVDFTPICFASVSGAAGVTRSSVGHPSCRCRIFLLHQCLWHGVRGIEARPLCFASVSGAAGVSRSSTAGRWPHFMSSWRLSASSVYLMRRSRCRSRVLLLRSVSGAAGVSNVLPLYRCRARLLRQSL